jgi:hypothetical protein
MAVADRARSSTDRRRRTAHRRRPIAARHESAVRPRSRNSVISDRQRGLSARIRRVARKKFSPIRDGILTADSAPVVHFLIRRADENRWMTTEARPTSREMRGNRGDRAVSTASPPMWISYGI